MKKREYIKSINRSLKKINNLESLACIWLYADALAEKEAQG